MRTDTLSIEALRIDMSVSDLEKVHELEEMLRILKIDGVDLQRTHRPPTVEEEWQDSHPVPFNQQNTPFSWVSPYQR